MGYGFPLGSGEVSSQTSPSETAPLSLGQSFREGCRVRAASTSVWGTNSICRRPLFSGEIAAIFIHCCGFQSYALDCPGEGVDPRDRPRVPWPFLWVLNQKWHLAVQWAMSQERKIGIGTGMQACGWRDPVSPGLQ